MRRAAIVVLNWNRADDTLDCLKSISKLDTDNIDLSVIVTDNGSTDDSVARLKDYKLPNGKYHILENGKNLGFAAGNNTGIKFALANGADFVVILNNDTVVDEKLLTLGLAAFDKDPNIGALSPKMYFAKGFEFHKDRYKENEKGKVLWYAGGTIDWANVYGNTRGVDEVDKGQYDKIEETDFATGTCMFLSKEALEKAGMFDEKYYMYYEDTDLSMRIRNAGMKVIYFPKARLWHKVAQSSGIGSNLNDYFTTRNRMLFGMKYASVRTKFALIRESIKLLVSGRKWQKIGIADFYLMKFGRGSWR